MDVDNEGDVDQALLQQFSCMGTSDKDELISELQKIMCGEINYSTAMFFLDMNNWNLQSAICSYLDTQTITKFPSMSLVDGVTNETDSVEPNVEFEKSWHVTNNGQEAWPPGCYVELTAPASLKSLKTMVPSLAAGAKMVLTVKVESPSTAGVYQGKWRLVTPNGNYFGDELWSFIYVTDRCTVTLTEQLSQLSELGSSPPTISTHNPFVQRSQVQNPQVRATQEGAGAGVSGGLLVKENLPPDGPDSAMC